MKSPLRYPGGKQRNAKQIVSLFPARVDEYREPFVGGGSVFLHARDKGIAQSYWINDKFLDLMVFWTAMKDDEKVSKIVDNLLTRREVYATGAVTERESFDDFKRMLSDSYAPKTPLSDTDKALMFFYLNRVTFSGTTWAGGFSKSAAKGRFTVNSIKALSALPPRLEGVTMTPFDAINVIKAPGSEYTFLYLDPPYYKAKKLYGRNGSLHALDHNLLAEALKDTHHWWLLSYDDCPEIRELYKDFNIYSWSKRYGMTNVGGVDSKLGKELFISNYKLSEVRN